MYRADHASGFFIEYAYNDSEKIIEATDSAGNQVFLSYEEDMLTSITHADGVQETFTYTALGQLATRALNGLVTTQTEYDSLGRAIKQEDTNNENQPITVEYNETNEAIAVTLNNRDGSQKTQHFNKDYEITSEIDELGNEISYSYNIDGRLKTLKDSKGYTTSFEYNDSGDVILITHPDGSTTSKEYDANRNVIKFTNQLGLVEHYEYDSKNNLTKKTNKLGAETVIEYNEASQPIKITSAEGRTSSFAYINGLLTTIFDHDGNQKTLQYNQVGHLIAETDFLGNITSYEVDQLGRVLSETDPLGNSKSWEYNYQGNVIKSTDLNGNVTQYEHDKEGNLLSRVNQLGDGTKVIWSYSYDAENRLTESTDPNGNVTTLMRDLLGRVVGIVDAEGNATEKTYDANGNVIKTIDALGQTAEFGYDERNQLIQMKDSLNQVHQFNYDKAGRLKSSKDPLQRMFFNVYDAESQLVKTVNPIGTEAKQSFDEDGNVVKVEDPNKNTRELTINKKGLVTQEKTADAANHTYQHNENGVVLESRDARGNASTQHYNAKSQLTQYRDSVSEIDYTYDRNGNLLTITDNTGEISRAYDSLNRTTEYTQYGQSIKYEYDNNSNLTAISYPSREATVSEIQLTYDEVNRLTSVSSFNSTGSLISYEYNKNGQVTLASRLNGTSVSYSYDLLGRVSKISDSLPNGSPLIVYDITYDELGRIVSEISEPNQPPTEEMIETLTMQYGLSNRLQDKSGMTFDFDADGNILEAEGLRLTFNSRKQLTSAGEHNYFYDAEGHRTKVANNSSSIEYVSNPNTLGLPNTIRETKDQNQRDFIYGNGLVAQYDRANDEYYYFHYDIRGSVVAVSNQAGEVVARYGYLPYGEQYHVQGNFDTPFGYNGRDGVITDDSGLYFMRARYYSPGQKRFLTKDPLRGGVENQTTLNRYAYVGGDPVNKIDPSGLCQEVTFQGAGTTLNENGSINGVCVDHMQAPWSPDVSYDVGGVRVSFVSEFLMSDNEVQDAISSACDKSKVDCVIAKTSYVAMEACFGAVETLGIEAGVTFLGKTIFTFGSKVYKVSSATKGSLKSLPGAKQIDAVWGGYNYYKRGGYMNTLEHINYKHSYGSSFNNSKYLENTSLKNIREYVDGALRYGNVSKLPSSTQVVYDLGRVIGTDLNGNKTTKIKVLVLDGVIQTAFPF